MADSPSYVNVVRDKKRKGCSGHERAGNQSESHYYTNPDCRIREEESDGYQIVQEHGRDPNGEYTDLTLEVTDDQVSNATLTREEMIQELLFPPQKGTRRFNYTDIQLVPKNELDKEQLHSGSDINEAGTNMQRKAKPKVMPKPNVQAEMKTQENEDDEDTYVEVNSTPNRNFNTIVKICTWKCTAVLYLVLLLISICISLTAISVATFVLTSRNCKQESDFIDCMITPIKVMENGKNVFLNNSCTTSEETITEIESEKVRILIFLYLWSCHDKYGPPGPILSAKTVPPLSWSAGDQF